MPNIWEKLKKPIFVLAPMENITDTVFRQMIADMGKPDLFFTEFVSCDGLVSFGGKKVARMLEYSDKEKPIIAQIWGNNPFAYKKAIRKIKKLGFDGIDINMGCPIRTVVAKDFCSALIKNRPLASELIETAQNEAYPLPVSVKTRIGYDKIITEDWIGFLLSFDLAAITIHGRTAKQMSKGQANWEEIGKAVKMRNSLGSKTLIMGNGDILTLDQANEKVKQYGVDGVMIGRGILHNPWLFDPKINPIEITITDKIRLLIKHLELFQKTWGKTKSFALMKKYYRIYINGFNQAGNIRERLMRINSSQETINYLSKSAEKFGK